MQVGGLAAVAAEEQGRWRRRGHGGVGALAADVGDEREELVEVEAVLRWAGSLAATMPWWGRGTSRGRARISTPLALLATARAVSTPISDVTPVMVMGRSCGGGGGSVAGGQA